MRITRESLVSVCAAGILGVVLTSSAQAVVIAKWTFETNTPPDAANATSNGPHAADEGAGQASGLHAAPETDWSTPVGNGSPNSYSSNTWAIGDYYQFMTSTAGASGITLLFDQTRSGTGPAEFKVQYSTDGSTFVDAPGASYTVQQITFSSGTEQTTTPPRFGFDLSSIPELDNQPSIALRLVATAAPAGTGGTNRIDNVIIGTDPIPEPAGLTVLAAAGLTLGARRRHI